MYRPPSRTAIERPGAANVAVPDGDEFGTPEQSAAWTPGHPGIALLSLTKALDASTTAIGLTLIPGVVESNPLAATLFSAVGVLPGLLVGTVAVLVCIVAITEAGAAWLGRAPDAPGWVPGATRAVCYLLSSLVFGAVAVHNAVLLWTAT